MSTAHAPRTDPPRFAATKIQAARPRARRIERPALDAALLDAALTRRIVLLNAPAGYGKTTALASLAAALPAGTALAWVSLDAGDDAARLFACLAAALEPFDLPWRTLPEALVPHVSAGDDGARRALDELVTAMAHADVAHGVIVVEDLHRVADRALVALGDQLIERLPRNWTLVLSSRELPALSLARWRAADELAEFDTAALRFSSDEAGALIAAEGLAAAGANATALIERTQGWPAGLRLTLVALKSRPGLAAAGALTERYLFDYLTSEVLDALPAPLHDFLLRCAVLPELTAARAAAVSGAWNAADLLDDIERRGLFVTTLATAERTLVLHDLFRTALEARLERRLPGELNPLLHRAAASEPDPARRIGYLLRAGDWSGAEAALDAAAPELFVGGGVGEVQRLIEQFDAGWRAASARLERLAGTVALLRWDWPAMERHFAAALAHAAAQDQQAERQHAQALLPMALYAMDRNAEAERLIAGLHAEPLAPHTRRLLLMADATQHFRRGQLHALPALYQEVVESLQRGASLFEWWECVPAPNWSTLPGMRQWFERYVDGALARIGSRPLPMRGEVIAQRAFVRLWAGRIDEARADIVQAEADLRWLACSGEMEIAITLFRLIECAICGRADELGRRLDAMLARESGAAPERLRLWQHQVAVYGVRMNHTLGAGPEVIAHWAAFLKEDPLRSTQYQNPRAIAVRARHAAASGRWRAAADGLQTLLPKLHEMDVMAHHVELRLRCAEAWVHCGEPDLAAQAVGPALERMQRDGDLGHAWMAGAAALRTLADTAWGARLPAAQQLLLQTAASTAADLRDGSADAPIERAPAASAEPAAGDATPAADSVATADAGLTSREAEVLALIATGTSNKLIARALDISPHTVKRHVANVLDKLGLQSRGQAAAWYLRGA
ncbi:transcriptional regulator [Aquincola sp. S2]|uniref:Transcriptional regulator n=1 Tax=Pseudaquabacterium terrae TaxID=2732868 RepID=A0ABX2E913_9BURK|nr:LuxR C-terminal-related transcriptional regulator [Aquabacterium terrae]NRF65376.1 transcriptional regulator [Aquabacterium terrae]